MQRYNGLNERAVEFGFVFSHMARLAPRRVLDVGTGTTALPALMRSCGSTVTAIDNVRDYWTDGMVNRHFHVIDDDIRHTRLQDRFDLITCISVLEHIVEHEAAVQNMFSLLAPQGHIVITCPYHEPAYCPNVYDLPGSSVKEKYGFVTQAFSRREVDAWLANSDAEIVTQEYWRFFTGTYWTEGKTIVPPQRASSEEPHQITCLLLRKRAGGQSEAP
jgi:2-polyprenyl-3-methyl-5-hydroxy-6-metoxy-1,4-benzoquinol methylase